MGPHPSRAVPPAPIRPRPLAALVLATLVAACGAEGAPSPSDIPDPVFTDPRVKLAETGDRRAFSETLFSQYVHQDPTLVDPSVSVFLTFYAGPNQRGLALAFVDTTNYLGGQSGHLRARAIWIEGTGDWQYAAYRLANESERWWERASQEDPTHTGAPLGDQVVVHGQAFTDPFPVTWAQYRQIWADYSAAYASLSTLFRAHGLAVHARAFAEGAGPGSAFWTECRTLRELQASGDVQSFLCAAATFPGYEDPSAWVECPADCRPPTQE
jgi:hypothetical protein